MKFDPKRERLHRMESTFLNYLSGKPLTYWCPVFYGQAQNPVAVLGDSTNLRAFIWPQRAPGAQKATKEFPAVPLFFCVLRVFVA
jgi:hypothetical protein